MPEKLLPSDALPRPIQPDDIECRNHYLEALFGEKFGSLPQVTLAPHVDTSDGSESVVIASQPVRGLDKPNADPALFDVTTATGEPVGFVVLNQPTSESGRPEKHLYIGDIKIFDEHRGQGYGRAAYLGVLKSLPEGRGLRTEGVLSPEALSIWSKMFDMGIARPSIKGGAPTGFETTY